MKAVRSAVLALQEAMSHHRRCSKCRQTLPLSAFHHDATASSGFTSACKRCRREQFLLYYAPRAEELREKNRAKMRQCRPNANAAQALWRARALNAVPAWYDVDKVREFYRQAHELTKQTGVPHEVDHIVPLCGMDGHGTQIVCGLHVQDNLQVITKDHNVEKGDRLEYIRREVRHAARAAD